MKNELKIFLDRVLTEAGVIDFKRSGVAPMEFDENASIERMKAHMREALIYMNTQFTEPVLTNEEVVVTYNNENLDIDDKDIPSFDIDKDVVPTLDIDENIIAFELPSPATVAVAAKFAVKGAVLVKTEIFEKKELTKKQQRKVDRKNEKRRDRLNSAENLSYSDRRNLINKILRSGQDICYNYEKRDQSVRVVEVSWNEEYTYDIPDEDSDFTYLYDSEAGIFKHFKLDKIMDIEFTYPLG